MRVFVNTPNGHVGRAVTVSLLDAGHTVVGLHRDPAKVADLVARGMIVVHGDLEDPAALAAGLDGADALFWVAPPFTRPDFVDHNGVVARQAVAVARTAGVTRAVLLSSIGAQIGEGLGPIDGLGPVEEAFRAALPDVTAVRAGFFMENLFNDLHALAGDGVVHGPLPADLAMPWVATADIGGVAARELTDPAWSGWRVVGAHGPVDLSWTDAAAALTEGLGRPIRYQQVPLAAFRDALVGFGVPAFVADTYAEMYDGFTQGGFSPAEPRTAQSTTTTTLATFARTVLGPAVAAQRAS